MHPDKRRAGRAIRKQRRAERDQAFNYVTSGQFGRDVKQVGNALAEAFTLLGEALRGLPAALRDMYAELVCTPSRQNQLALTPSAGSLPLSEVGMPYPTQSGVEALRSPQSDSAEERMDAAAAKLGVQLLPWQRAAGAAALRGERTLVASGRGVGRSTLGRVVEEAQRGPEPEVPAWIDEAADCGGWEDH